MTELAEIAPPFVEMAHRIVWATVATTAPSGRPRTRILHPIWQWDGEELVGWIATSPTPLKQAHLAHQPHVSLTYWDPSHDTCSVEAEATWHLDDDTCRMVWDLFANGPEPVGYDPAIIPPWSGGPTSDAFAVLRLDPSRIRVMPGSLMLAGQGSLLTWAR